MHQHLYNKQEKNILLVAKKFSLSLLQSGDICWPFLREVTHFPQFSIIIIVLCLAMILLGRESGADSCYHLHNDFGTPPAGSQPLILLISYTLWWVLFFISFFYPLYDFITMIKKEKLKIYSYPYSTAVTRHLPKCGRGKIG